jgi:hypothetical protein
MECNYMTVINFWLNGQEDIEQELSKVSRASKGPGVSKHIMV